jgi:hypothetical protein
MRREAHANLQVCKTEKADKFANSKLRKSNYLVWGKKRGHAHCNSSFARKKKLTNLQMANSLFMMGHSMNKILTMAPIITWDQMETKSRSQHLGLVKPE